MRSAAAFALWLFACWFPGAVWAAKPARRLERAEAAVRARKFRTAARLYEGLLEHRFGLAARRLCAVYSALGSWQRARELFQRAVRKIPGQPYFWHCLGLAEHQLGRYRRAVAAFRRETRLRPMAPGGWFALGRSLAALGRRAGAASALSRYLALEERPWAKPWRARAQTLLEALLDGRTLPDWVFGARRAKPRRPGPGAAAPGEKETLRALREGDLRRAAELGAELVRRSPRSAVGYVALGKWHLAAGRTEEAVRILRLGLRRVPVFPEGRVLLARAYLRQGKRSGAIFQMRVLARSRNLPPDVAGQAARLARRMGLFDLASGFESAARRGGKGR